jgi:tRNA(Met) cytidine acetyltransferase
LQRFMRIAQQHSFIHQFKQGERLPLPYIPRPIKPRMPAVPTLEQTQVIQDILASVHMQQVLVLNSDRGRGKTAVLGMAAAQLIEQGMHHIVVTAPSMKSVRALFEHADACLPGAIRTQPSCLQLGQSEIHFMAPDSLVAEPPIADLLIVDEAAAIPMPMLTNMLDAYGCAIFSTTEHGYEGTGRGFATRFTQLLTALRPDWQQSVMSQPIRWNVNDPLESFTYDALMLDAEPLAEPPHGQVFAEDVALKWLSAEQLVNDEACLRDVFGLLALAHYRTRPSDLQMLLDRQDMQIAVLKHDGQTIAALWLVDEPALSPELARSIFEGRRRLKGLLCPQSLVSHVGILDMGQYHYQRVARIVVHPDYQRQGWGKTLLSRVLKSSRVKADFIGTSFAVSTELLHFWQQQGFKAVRVGQQKDEVTGRVSVMLLKATHDEADKQIKHLHSLLSHQQRFLKQRNACLLSEATWNALELFESADVDFDVLSVVKAFAYDLRSYASSDYALFLWWQDYLSAGAPADLDELQRVLIQRLVVEGQTIKQVVSELRIAGKHACIEALRRAVTVCLNAQARMRMTSSSLR